MKKLNVCGLECPEPLMLVRQEIRHMEDGDLLEVIADDPSTTRDIPSFCRHLDHRLLKQTSQSPYMYVIEK